MTSLPDNSNFNTGSGNPTVGSGSLMDGLSVPAPVNAPRKPRLQLTLPAPLAARLARVKAEYRARMSDPTRRKKTQTQLTIAGVFLAAGLGVGLYFALRPVPQPDYLRDPLNDVFNYTLLTDEFNKLPVEERLKLIGQLVQRMRSMSSGDSMLLAGFAAGIAGAARQQIEENASRLAIDTWDKYAKDYTNVPEEDRAEYLDQTFLEFIKMMEAVGGEPKDIPDEKRLADVRKQSDRDRAQMADPTRAPSGKELGRMFTFMDRTVGGHASPEKRQRGMLMMRDMVRHFRNQDTATGKPAGGG